MTNSTVTNRHLDAYKAHFGIPSDNKLADHWHISRQRIGQYRRGDTALSEERCMEIAAALHIPAETILLEIQAERARKQGKPGIAEILEDVLKRLKHGVTALLVLAVCGTAFMPNDAYADLCQREYVSSPSHNPNVVIIGIMLNIRDCLLWVFWTVATIFGVMSSCHLINDSR